MNGPVENKIARFASASALAGLLVLCTGLAGCASLSGGGTVGAGGPDSAAAPVQHPLLENIPLPAGFKMVPERSVARASGQMRVANCEFQGGIAPDEVTRFYMSYMPTARFILKQRRFDNGQYTLRFESDVEECTIGVKRGKLSTTLVVDIGPLAKGTAEREVEPTRPRP